MPDIRLVALDLDGTVFNDEKEITPRTLEAIRAAIAKGVDVIPATGRVASGVPEAFLRIPGVRYALTSNGASVVELSTGKPLVNLPFDAALASDIYDIVAATGGAMGIFIGGKAYTDYFGANDGLALMPLPCTATCVTAALWWMTCTQCSPPTRTRWKSSASPIGTMPPAMPPGRLLPAGLMLRLLPAFPTTWRSTPPA